MTTEAPPEHLYALTPLQANQVTEDPLVRAINRLAAAIERATTLTPQTPQLAPLPPVASVNPIAPGYCPVHRLPWKMVPAGISKKSGNRYEAFLACPERGCDQRPA